MIYMISNVALIYLCLRLTSPGNAPSQNGIFLVLYVLNFPTLSGYSVLQRMLMKILAGV
jgi:hypothetical protein